LHGYQRRTMDDEAHAGFDRVLLLPEVPAAGGQDSDASLGAGHHVSRPRAAPPEPRCAAEASVSFGLAPALVCSPPVSAAAQSGLLIVNADDWGRDAQTTGCILDCVTQKAVSAVSAMVFMEDSDRAAAVALEHAIDAGLHLNFTSPFTASACPAGVVDRQRRIAAYLGRHRLAQLVFNPALVNTFEYVVAAQIDEYRRLYGADPTRLDGHHHMHLCANVLLQGLLPPGTLVRR